MKSVVNLHSVCLFILLIDSVVPIMLKKECPKEQSHKSCSFYEEYTCWESIRLTNRVKIFPKRLLHCRSGCFCKRSLVRAFPNGPCIPAGLCKNRELQDVMERLPEAFRGFF